MERTSLPEHLPHTVDQLVEELNILNPAPVVDSLLTCPDDIQRKVFEAGRRSVVEELVRLNKKAKE